MEPLERISNVTKERFASEILPENRPLIVTGAMTSWPALSKWTPEYFMRNFGDAEVQIYDHLFSLVDVNSLCNYIQANLGQPEGFESQEYVRGYAKFKDIDFAWADEIFAGLANDWDIPDFFPRESFVLPPGGPAGLSPVTDPFPYKGLFISGRGARTRLHKDPFGTEAILCQFHGQKEVFFYPPADSGYVYRQGEFADPRKIDRQLFPQFGDAKPVYRDILSPGEILFIPGGWFHDVLSLSDSISVTWNFVHSARREQFDREVSDASVQRDRDVLEFFLKETP